MASDAGMTISPLPITDPARELAELCGILNFNTKAAGDDYLAKCFEVDPWSSDFYQIVFCIVERADTLIGIVTALDIDEDLREEAISHINEVKRAFSKASLFNAWNAQGTGASLLSSLNVQPIKMLSPMVRIRVSYVKLDADAIAELLEDAAEFQGWLSEHQIEEQDFVRQAIIDGLKQFRFRLGKFQWLGWGYTFDSLREVIAAYKMLQTTVATSDTNPHAEAILKKGLSFFVKVFEKVGVAKDTVERADFLLRAYGAINLVHQGTTAVGLLTHLKG
jgi:hypothetical protein